MNPTTQPIEKGEEPMARRQSDWRADCPKCVGSKFTCDEHYVERQCEDCGEAAFYKTNDGVWLCEGDWSLLLDRSEGL